jgi:hypothetical protein
LGGGNPQTSGKGWVWAAAEAKAPLTGWLLSFSIANGG